MARTLAESMLWILRSLVLGLMLRMRALVSLHPANVVGVLSLPYHTLQMVNEVLLLNVTAALRELTLRA